MKPLVRLVGILNLVAGLLSLPACLIQLQPILFPPENPMGEGLPVPWVLPLVSLLVQALLSVLTLLGGLGVLLLLPPGRRLLLVVTPLVVAAALLVPGSRFRAVSIALSAGLCALTWAVLLLRDGQAAFRSPDRYSLAPRNE